MVCEYCNNTTETTEGDFFDQVIISTSAPESMRRVWICVECAPPDDLEAGE